HRRQASLALPPLLILTLLPSVASSVSFVKPFLSHFYRSPALAFTQAVWIRPLSHYLDTKSWRLVTPNRMLNWPLHDVRLPPDAVSCRSHVRSPGTRPFLLLPPGGRSEPLTEVVLLEIITDRGWIVLPAECLRPPLQQDPGALPGRVHRGGRACSS